MYCYLRDEDDEGNERFIVENALEKWAKDLKSTWQTGGLNTQSPSPAKAKANHGRAAARSSLDTLEEAGELAI